MRDISRNARCAALFQCRRRMAQRACRIHHVVDHYAVAVFDLTDNVHDFRLIRLIATFIDDDEIRIVKPLRQRPRTNNTADVRRHHNHFFVFLLPHIAKQQRRGINVVDRNIEETLDLVGVQVHCQYPINTGSGNKLRDQFCGNGYA